MPTPTDLVTDLPADFEVFGQAVDTSMADLKGGTTGQILSKASNTDMDFTWIANDQGDITGVTAGTGISGGGTSGTVTITNSMATAIDAKGDLIAGTGADTFDRLASGTTGQILSVDTTTTTGLKWITPNPGDITAVNVTSPITGGGTSGDVTIGIQDASTTQKGSVQLSDSTSTTSSTLAATPTAVKAAYDLANTASTTATAAIPKSTVTTAGDLIVATGSSAVTRLGIGTNGQVLQSNGTTATWATPSSGAYTTLASGTLSGTTVTISSISGSYKELILLITNFRPGAANYPLYLQFNGDTGSNYGDTTATDATNISYGSARARMTAAQSATATNQQSITSIPNYANSTVWKFFTCDSIQNNNTTTTNYNYNRYAGFWNGTAAITSITMLTTQGFTAGNYELLGVK